MGKDPVLTRSRECKTLERVSGAFKDMCQVDVYSSAKWGQSDSARSWAAQEESGR